MRKRLRKKVDRQQIIESVDWWGDSAASTYRKLLEQKKNELAKQACEGVRMIKATWKIGMSEL